MRIQSMGAVAAVRDIGVLIQLLGMQIGELGTLRHSGGGDDTAAAVLPEIRIVVIPADAAPAVMANARGIVTKTLIALYGR